MQPQDLEQDPSPLSAQSDLSTTAETNGHSLLPNKVDDENHFAFDVYSQVPCKATGDKLEWDKGVTWMGHGTAKRNPKTGQIEYEWKGPHTEDGKMSEASFKKDSHFPHATLRQETSAGGHRSRYVQNFGQWNSNLPDKERFPHVVDKLLVGRWYNNPTSSSPSAHSSAEKDDYTEDLSAKEEEGEASEDEWVEVPGHTWKTVHKTGPARSFW